MNNLITLIVVFAIFTCTFAKEYDMNNGMISVSLCAAAYCNPDQYLTHNFDKGVIAGFVPTYHIDGDHDTQGFIGYLNSTKQIFVSFRGSESISNWITNIEELKTDYPYCSGCEVHKGFYKAQKGVKDAITNNVLALHEQFPDYSIWVTGHSLGAALATLTAVDLQQAGMKVNMQNFGSPRVGNTNFANWIDSNLTSHMRNTHHKDIVPHMPMHERFTHIDGEWYEDPVLSLKECFGNEDKDCSYQWHITSIDDHLLYLGMTLGEDGCAAV
jgi:hypothetical protein